MICPNEAGSNGQPGVQTEGAVRHLPFRSLVPRYLNLGVRPTTSATSSKPIKCYCNRQGGFPGLYAEKGGHVIQLIATSLQDIVGLHLSCVGYKTK
jgi:hypothetical protein